MWDDLEYEDSQTDAEQTTEQEVSKEASFKDASSLWSNEIIATGALDQIWTGRLDALAKHKEIVL